MKWNIPSVHTFFVLFFSVAFRCRSRRIAMITGLGMLKECKQASRQASKQASMVESVEVAFEFVDG